MIEDLDSLDNELAAFRRLEADLSRAIAACQTAHVRGGIGYDEYLVAENLEKRLLAAGTALVAKINEALKALAPAGSLHHNKLRG